MVNYLKPGFDLGLFVGVQIINRVSREMVMKMLTSPSEKWLTSYVHFWDVKKRCHTAQNRLMKKMSKKHNSNYENTEIRKNKDI